MSVSTSTLPRLVDIITLDRLALLANHLYYYSIQVFTHYLYVGLRCFLYQKNSKPYSTTRKPSFYNASFTLLLFYTTLIGLLNRCSVFSRNSCMGLAPLTGLLFDFFGLIKRQLLV